MSDWLEDFTNFASFGEASPRAMKWVGISTIAAVLRRKVWIDQEIFQWSPNFYILLVGAPGAVKKSTSIDVGMRLLRQVEGINHGPAITTWQALIESIAELKENVVIPTGEIFEMSCITLAISEFGSFFDPTNRDLVDNLTDLFDGKLGTIEKKTKTSGCDSMVNAWINIIAATTPKWLAQNFGDALVGGGLAGRFIYLFESMPGPEKDVAYPKLEMGDMRQRREDEAQLVAKLSIISKYAGEFELTVEAYEWGKEWYAKERAIQRALGSDSLESGFIVRKQTFLHKLAMVISAARFEFPTITMQHLKDAESLLAALDADTKKVFGYVGQSKVTTAAREIVEAVHAAGSIEKRLLFQKRFFRTMTIGEYNEAVASAIQAELIMESDGVAKPVLMPR